jgi:putative transposase
MLLCIIYEYIPIMAHTFSSLNVHCIFSTKERVPILGPEISERLWPYLGGIAKRHNIRPVCIGGVADHVHMLLSLPTTIAVAKAIQAIKGASSAWVHDTFRELNNFAWQEGYGAFSVSVSHLSETIDYIQNQAEHHRTWTFREEYLAILKKHNLQFEDKYLWG